MRWDDPFCLALGRSDIILQHEHDERGDDFVRGEVAAGTEGDAAAEGLEGAGGGFWGLRGAEEASGVEVFGCGAPAGGVEVEDFAGHLD